MQLQPGLYFISFLCGFFMLTVTVHLCNMITN